MQRGGERVFKTPDAVAALLGSVGITSFSVELQSSVSIPPLIEVPAILDPLCSNPRDYNHGGLPPLVPAIGKSVIPQGNNAVTEPPSFRGRDLFSDLGVYPLQSPKADPPRAKRKKRNEPRRSVDNCPAHRGKPLVDGLRYGSSPPRQASFLKASMSGKARKESAEALPLARLRPPAFDTCNGYQI